MDRTDNYFKFGPAKMSDGRVFTDYRSATTREEFNKKQQNISRDDAWRIYLQENGENIMENEWTTEKQQYFIQPRNCVHVYGSSVNPQTFVTERRQYDSMSDHPNKVIYPCKKLNDYRLTITKKC